ncbi:Inositol-pentakisphosphate 2-kinase [Kalmusia sp. IMI 367209]|nr:Inositol-pentakisphosphate 2-kinase [Kalmusia sp. IMI 367209]
MAPQKPRPTRPSIGNPDTIDEEQEPDSQPLHEPKIRCRLARPQDSDTNTVRFAFLAEGAANAVFSVNPALPEKQPCFVFEDQSGETIPRARIINKVLRISKGNPKTLKYKEIMDGFETEVVPLFRKSESPESETTVECNDSSEAPKNALNLSIPDSYEEFVMEHEGVAISPDSLRIILEELHAHCPHNKHIAPHHLEERGILLPDMSSHPRSSLTIEIKPKWLAQSPNAPRDAHLCRTCALHALRKSQKDYHGSWICPLQLVAGNITAIKQYLRDRIKESEELPVDVGMDVAGIVFRRAVPYLTSGPGHKILQHIRYLQTRLDNKGVLVRDSTSHSDHCLRLAMTLRDCSLFVKIPYADENAPIEAKLGDLDFKSHGKIDDWIQKEVALLGGGWYLDVSSGMDQCLMAEGWRRYVP